MLASRKQQVVTWVLVLAILIQGWLVLSEFVLPLRRRIRTVDEMPALERSAYLSFGDEFAQFMALTRENVPEGAVVVVPSMSTDQVYGNPALMSYFLYPRSIRQCGAEEALEACAQRYATDEQYLISTSIYHAEGSDEVRGKRWIPYKGDMGIYVPQP